MKPKPLIRRAIIKSLQTLGYDFDKISLEGALERCQSRGVDIHTVIDVGASNGMWTEKCKEFFPDADYLLIEAQAPHEEALMALQERMPNMHYVMAAAGDRSGDIYFEANDLFGGSASHTPLPDNCITVPVTTIDEQVARHNLKPPYLLKLDTHGFELPILTGAKETLPQAELIVVETYNFQVAPDSLRFHEMCAYMEERAFRCIDICDPLHRPKDRALWQFDLFFAPTDSPAFKSNAYI